ncbi:GAF domain-containing protein [Curtobacterium sp. MCBA15_012]|uniref:GAF domain-containing protein n=1 Tax=Curtobacterium sp. MCBA15_012 TaxID=1898738 RepID=UPI000B27C02E|nr:GAF domain-containing protein [Curtobacterium sp. MCBA15_012]WIA98695.1 GAF domain-containing protein [Curtobacterium sp. MCBA15_012]
MSVPAGLRPLVAASWRRSSRVDPDGTPALALDDDQLDALRAEGPIGTALPVVRRLLLDEVRAAGCVVAVTDATGCIVWVDGARRARRAAEDMGFTAGADWAEDHVGTSAPGTALRLGRGVQIRSEEHYATAVKAFSCTAVPLHAADGSVVGALDITGDDRAVERHTLPLLTATAAAAEAQIALAAVQRPPGAATEEPTAGVARRRTTVRSELDLLGSDTATLRTGDRSVRLSERHSEVLAVLASTPGGLAAEDLAVAVYGDRRAVPTLRAEVVRLRRVLAEHAPDARLTSRPYRLTGIRTDVDTVLSALDRGARLQAVDGYPGPVLPGSASPGVDDLRDAVRLRFRESVLTDGGAEALHAWSRTADGAADPEVLRALLAVLPRRSPRRAGLVAAIEALERR